MERSSLEHGNNRLEKVLFEIICIMISIVMVHGLLQGLILYGITFLTFVELAVISICGSFYYLSRFRGYFEKLRIPLVIFCNCCLIFFWFWLSGMLGPTGIGAVAIGIVSIIILPSRLRSPFLILTMSLLVALVMLQMHTDWVRTSAGDYETLPYDYLVILIGVLLIVNYLKTEFDKERQVVVQQNKELEFLNASLEKAVLKNEATIKKLKATRMKLVNSEKMASIGRLTAGLAHELNNPLNFIGGSVKPIRDDLTEIRKTLKNSVERSTSSQFIEINKLLENIEEGSARASGIIRNLMQISPRSIDSKNIVDVHELVRRTCALFQNAYTDIHLTLIIHDPVLVRGNTSEINQVLLNVIKNAVDAVSGKPKGQVKVIVSEKDDIGEITIQDNGPGIPKAIRSQVFEPFFTTKEEGKGTGLGLYISYGILRKHKGMIHLDSERKKGTRFTITLPTVNALP